jgi:hypothetical protein
MKDMLVGGFNPSEKYMFVSWDYYSQYMDKYKNVPNHQSIWEWVKTCHYHRQQEINIH